MARLRVGVLVSGKGRGTNLQALIDARERGELGADLVLVVSTSAEAGALERARKHSLEALFVDPKQFATAEELDLALAQTMEQRQVGLICLAGYMRMLTAALIRRFPNRIMNIHPALLPAFGGKGMYGHHVHEAVIASGAKYTGVTVHFADEEYDHGPIALQKVVEVLPDDDADSLAARVLREEHKLYARAVHLFAEGRLQVEDRRVRILPSAP
ncbi:MAG: phosphoribosylglycinamide formyltransferase [Armatimonadetes bacterium CG_4_9_14_3_um_filter_66_14]|nr:MAG: phosphoribosylglycinamide formyltransferase [Armatimonadetes bacterium CG_4_9_14_3_um_filter_66_14]